MESFVWYFILLPKYQKIVFQCIWFDVLFFSVHHLQNKSLPWDYDFRFVIEEISNINDKEQVSDDSIGDQRNI